MKETSGSLVVDEKEIRDMWKKYLENLINEENRIGLLVFSNVKHAAQCTEKVEQKSKHKAQGLSGLLAEMVQATEDIRIHWLTNLCSGIMKECCIAED